MNSRAVFGGIVLILAGAAMLASRLGLFRPGFWAFFWLAAAVAGFFLLVRGFRQKGGRGKIFWGVLLLAFGTFQFLDRTRLIYPDSGYVVAGTFAVLGVAFLAASSVRPSSLPMVVVGVAGLVLGGGVLLAEIEALNQWDVKDAIATWWPAALVLFGASMLVPRRKA
jgi:hypothetical protein